jgi:starch phosphorylase
MNGTRFTLEVQPILPERLQRLQELANDLFYSWDREVRGLFFRLDRQLWDECGHNPKLFLRRVSQKKLDRAAQDNVFVEDINRVLSSYDTYRQERYRSGLEEYLDPESDLIAYFCAEFGFHESFPVYSGGLGILAGDHCKAASDLGVPLVAVGLLYHQGYFRQRIDGFGNQVAHYVDSEFTDLPISPALDAKGQEVHVQIHLPGRGVMLKVWKAVAGHVTLYLLDSDLEANAPSDRAITHQLYGGDVNTRIQQEIVLGVGGVRALTSLGLQPTVWHINEGHAAFQILERTRRRVAKGMEFEAALELVAAGTVFTTHTPVPAGHDMFEHHLISSYFADYIDDLGITMERFLALGTMPENPHVFNQTALALRGSRFHNGVSRIHGGVASEMESYVWPQVPPAENPIRYVTNGVHVHTFLAREWANLFDMRFGGGWRNELLSQEFWKRVDEIPDHGYWSLHQSLKAELMVDVRRRVRTQFARNGCSDVECERLMRFLDPDESGILTIGFARRFATYKRAALIFNDPERLARLVNDPERPVMLIFAGKAHPHDEPGRHLIQVINGFSRRPEFEGRVLMLEDYDLSLARKLVSGVDVWLNNPEYPLEASGTSGQKAGINGVLNLSVLDGWWGEGYEGDNGWAIAPHGPEFDPAYRQREDARELLDLLEHEIIPLYYDRNGHGFSDGWVKKSKQSMKTLMPRYNAERMVMDYVMGFYAPAARQRRRLLAEDAAGARELATWKSRVRKLWPGVRVSRRDPPPAKIRAGETLPVHVSVELGGLTSDDIVVECLVGIEGERGELLIHDQYQLTARETDARGQALFTLDISPTLPGLQYYQLRAYPYHRLLSHRFELGCMLWV